MLDMDTKSEPIPENPPCSNPEVSIDVRSIINLGGFSNNIGSSLEESKEYTNALKKKRKENAPITTAIEGWITRVEYEEAEKRGELVDLIFRNCP